jgi:hypothetical protein
VHALREMRALICFALAGCIGAAPAAFKPEPLPELVVTKPPTAALAVKAMLLTPGEHMIWDVSAKGFAIARAELLVADDDTTSKLKTTMLASSFTSLDHELVTTLDRAAFRPRTSVETLTMNSEVTHTETAFGGEAFAVDGQSQKVANAQTIHTALGIIRAWAEPEAHGGFMNVVVGGVAYRLELDQPGVEELQGKQTIRVMCRILPPASAKDHDPIRASIWLSFDEDRVPLRIEIASSSGKLVAELVERTHA